MPLHSQEDALFQRWSQRRPNLVADGIVDEATWQSSRHKILFMLKEVNSPEKGKWDLRRFLREGGRPQTWNAAGRWVRAIQALPEDRPWSADKKITNGQRIEMLKSIAVMNIKKSPGGATSDEDEVLRIALEDHEYIEEQYKLYDADIVILCGVSVGVYYRKKFTSIVGGKWNVTSRGISFLRTDTGKIIVDYFHPSARVSPLFFHYPLLDAIREIRQQSPTKQAPP